MDKITKVINEWDPINLFPNAPEDEYEHEIVEIAEYVEKMQDITVENLAREINRIFAKSFGTDVYKRNEEFCVVVAKKIIDC